MALNESFKTTGNANVKLTKLASIPSIQDLDFAMSQASKHPRAIIELPWKTANATTTFVLKVCTAAGSEDGPSWTLHAGESMDAAVLWSHDSMDTFLIQSLISAESDSSRSLQTYVDTSKQAPILDEPTPPPQPQSPPRSARPNLPAPMELDRAMLDAMQWHLRRQETGLLSEAYAYHLLIQEFNRFTRYQTPFAFVLFELAMRLNDGTITLPPVRLLHESANRIQGIGRSLDNLCHFADPRLCLVLPHTGSNETVQLCMRIEQALLQSPLAPGLDASNVLVHFGIASIPDTCEHPGILIAAAMEALEQAKKSNTSVVMFPSS